MKHKILSLAAIIVVAITIVSFTSNTTKIDTKTNISTFPTVFVASQYAVDINTSTIAWKGSKPTGYHGGTIKLLKGNFSAKKNKLSAGTFTIEMASIKEAYDNKRLEGHLKGEHFFDVEAYPTATFEVTGFDKENGKTMLTGDFTMKGKTNSISFPVTVSNAGDNITLISETFTIDRSKWNVRYGSKSFFDNLGDRFISDDIELKIDITANPL